MTVLTEINNSTDCLCSAYAVPVAEKTRSGNTPNRVIRVSDEDWVKYGEAVARMGSTRSDDMRRHIKATIAADEREQRRIARESSGD
jgi:deoxycytidylate deaminase